MAARTRLTILSVLPSAMGLPLTTEYLRCRSYLPLLRPVASVYCGLRSDEQHGPPPASFRRLAVAASSSEPSRCFEKGR